MSAFLAVLMIGLAFAPNMGWSQNAENVRVVGRWPYGTAFAVTVQGNYAFLGSGTAILVLDTTEPSSPEKVADLAIPGVVYGLFISGNLLYIAGGHGGLRVVDVSVPASPQEAGYYDTPGRGCLRFRLSGLCR
jgi:hypothetical protein